MFVVPEDETGSVKGYPLGRISHSQAKEETVQLWDKTHSEIKSRVKIPFRKMLPLSLQCLWPEGHTRQ